MIIDDTKSVRDTLEEIAMERSESDSENYTLLDFLNRQSPLLPFDQTSDYPDQYPFDICRTQTEKERMLAAVLTVQASVHADKVSNAFFSQYEDLIHAYYRNITKLDESLLTEDPFLSHISLPLGKEGNFLFGFRSYEKNRLFHYGEPVEKEYADILQLAWFSEDVRYPYITRNGNYFDSISADTILSAQSLIRPVSRNVLILGCGIGYLPYLIHCKESVSSVTVIEKDPEIADLFQNRILPQFDHPDQIRMIQTDPYAYLKNPDQDYQWIINNLYNDSMNGVFSYLSMKKLEFLHKHAKYAYWIEGSILSNLKSAMLILVMSAAFSDQMEDHLLSDEEQGREIVNALQPFTDTLHIHTSSQLKQLFSNRNLKKILARQGTLSENKS